MSNEDPVLTQSELDAIASREQAATKGPWQWREDYGSVSLHSLTAGPFQCIASADPCGHENSSISVDKADADFIEHARMDVPKLLAEVRRLGAENAQFRNERELHLTLITQDAQARDKIRTGWVTEEREWHAERARLRELALEACDIADYERTNDAPQDYSAERAEQIAAIRSAVRWGIKAAK